MCVIVNGNSRIFSITCDTYIYSLAEIPLPEQVFILVSLLPSVSYI